MSDEDILTLLQIAEAMDFENWKKYRALSNAKIDKLQARVETLESVLRYIAANTSCERCLHFAPVAFVALGQPLALEDRHER